MQQWSSGVLSVHLPFWLQGMNTNELHEKNKVFFISSVFLIVIPWGLNFTGNWAQDQRSFTQADCAWPFNCIPLQILSHRIRKTFFLSMLWLCRSFWASCSSCLCFELGGWTRQSLEVTSNLGHSLILWCRYPYQMASHFFLPFNFFSLSPTK